nr:unnamed protein product [Callosobruchus chinensis]
MMSTSSSDSDCPRLRLRKYWILLKIFMQSLL